LLGRALLIVHHRSRRSFAQFKPRADFLDLRCLLFDLRGEDFHSFVLLHDRARGYGLTIITLKAALRVIGVKSWLKIDQWPLK
jgi:hypothetical protein